MSDPAARTGAHAVLPTPDAVARIRTLTELLAEPLSAEDQTVQSMPDVSPTKWHRAHTSWFFETFVLGPAQDRYEVFDPTYAYLFNSYYETVGPRHARPERGLLTRPGITDVSRYRAHVDGALATFLHDGPEQRWLDLVTLGLHHEQQHQELLLMDAKHVLSCNPFHPAYRPPVPRRPGRGGCPADWHGCDGGLVEVGHEGTGFGFDNELPRHRVWVEPFELRTTLVTCGEWLEFMDDGGYARPELWLSDGWAARGAASWAAPMHWVPTDGGWQVFTLTGIRPVDPAEPVVHVSYYEADAFARWAGARLPTESEWETVAATVAGDPRPYDPCDVHPVAADPGRTGVQQLHGEVWQWTSSAYLPYPGFRPAAGAVGEYNGKFMVNQQVLRGSACATPAGHARDTYRNFFPAGARWAFSGLRLAR